MARGRKRGFCGILATQRISKLHKDAAAETNNVFIGRARQDIDRKRAAEELGLTSKVAALELRSLKAGEFFSFGPALDPGDVTRFRFGTVKTSHPKEGAGAPPVSKPRARVKAVLKELVDLPAEAEEEARSVEDLRAKIRQLQAEARQMTKDTPQASADRIEEIREDARRQAQASADESLDEVHAQAKEFGKTVCEAIDALTIMPEQADRLMDAEIIVSAPSVVRTPERNVQPPMPTPAPTRPRREQPPGADSITGPMQRVLDAIAWLESIGLPTPYAKIQVAFVARYRPTSGGFANILGTLRSAGLISYPSAGNVALTDDGGASANSPDTAPTTEDLHRRIRELISEPMWRCLEPLIDAYPNSMQKSELADAAVYSATSGGFAKLLGKLRTLGLIDYPSPGAVVARSVLFPSCRSLS